MSNTSDRPTQVINDGGPAFPRPTTQWSDAVSGMSLRAYFAGQALQGLLANPYLTGIADGPLRPAFNIDVFDSRRAAAFKAVQFTDALIAELQKGETGK